MSIPTNGLGVCLLLVGLTAGAAIAREPSVSVTIDSIEKTDAGFVVSGTAVAEGPVSAGHGYQLAVLAEIMDGDGAQYPKLADAMRIRDPAGAETSFVPGSGPGGTMTRDEYHGVNITTIRLASLGAPGTFDFTGTIPAEHADKPFRIRAELNHQVNYTGAAWPSITFQHGEGFSGTVAAHGASGDFSFSGSTEDKPYELPDDIGLTPQSDGNYDGRLGKANTIDDGEASSEGITADPPGDKEKIEDILANAQAQMANPNLTDEQRKELIEAFNNAVLGLGEMEAQQIWDDYYVHSSLTVTDTMLTYNPATGLYWTGSKVAIYLADGQWKKALWNASTMIPAIKVPGIPVPVEVGQLIQVGSDYYNTYQAFKTGCDWNDGPTPINTSGTYWKWNHGQSGYNGLPGDSKPILGPH